RGLGVMGIRFGRGVVIAAGLRCLRRRLGRLVLRGGRRFARVLPGAPDEPYRQGEPGDNGAVPTHVVFLSFLRRGEGGRVATFPTGRALEITRAFHWCLRLGAVTSSDHEGSPSEHEGTNERDESADAAGPSGREIVPGVGSPVRVDAISIGVVADLHLGFARGAADGELQIIHRFTRAVEAGEGLRAFRGEADGRGPAVPREGT